MMTPATVQATRTPALFQRAQREQGPVWRCCFKVAIVSLLVVGASGPVAQGADKTPVSSPAKVPLAFNRLYDYPDLVDALRTLVRARPDLLTMKSLGKSVEGRDLWCVTVNNPVTGNDRDKPAMYVDGNIHGNEVQAAETCLYLIWYLVENYDRVENLHKLVDERAFYIVPTVNPDGRAYWFSGPNTTHSSRSGKSPLDDDRDGVADEDGYDDLDGDGQITQMRRKNPNGRFKASPVDHRLLVQVKPGEQGEYDFLGMEGIDNDGDGLVNEDPPGGYDMNRNWPADWQPDYIQGGAGNYPLCWPETRATAEFLIDHPNVAGVQAFHNAAGMILRGPAHTSRQGQYPAGDDRIADVIGQAGARMIPYYKNSVIHRDLYDVHGGFIGWTYEHLGIFSFTNELWNNDQLLGRHDPPASGSALSRATGGSEEDDDLFASDRLLFGAQFVPWKPIKHPLYGDIEIGGFVKQSQRVPPPFMLEELCHRNAAFVVYHADQMPRIFWGDVEFQRIGPETFSVTAEVRNTRLIPSIAQQAIQHRVGLPDTLSLSGPEVTVVGGGVLVNRDTGQVDPVERDPGTIRLPGGVGSEATVRVRWFVRGKGEATVRYASQKGGKLSRAVTLKE